MRPVKLVMSAFGPYAGKVELDFERLGTDGIYLLCGDTGAGKTTVFDAISFALFGHASGDGREARTLRSDFADAATPTYVDLVFAYRGEEYRIRRNPEYLRAARRGTGMTTELADAELIYPDGRRLTKTRAVDAAVRELLGIDRNQFGQIVMIAQGDFRRLLNADTNERVEIFRRVFDTGSYQAFSQMLETRRRSLEETVRRLREEVRTLAGGILLAPDDPRCTLLSDWRERDALAAGPLADLLEEAVREDAAQLEETDRRRLALEAGIEEASADLERARTARRLVGLLNQQDREAQRLDAQTPALQERFDRSRETEGACRDIEAREAVIRNSLDRYDQLDRLREELARTQQEAEEALLARENLDKLFDTTRRAATDAEAREKSLAGYPAELAEASAVQTQAQRLADEARETLDLARRARVARHQCDDLDQGCRDLEREAETSARLAASYESKLSDLRNREAQLSDAPELAARNQAEIEATQVKVERVRADQTELARREDGLAEARELLARQEDAYRYARQRAEQANADHIRLQTAFYDGQAGLLAKSLVDGMPCPVCGSTAHPAPAASIHGVPTQDEVEAAERARAAAADALARESGRTAAARACVEERLAARDAFAHEHGEAPSLTAQSERYGADLDHLQHMQAQQQGRVDELQTVRRAIADAESNLEDGRASVEKASAKLARQRAALAAQQASLAALTDQLRGTDEAAAHRRADETRSDVAAASERVARAQQGVADLGKARDDLARLRRRLEDAESRRPSAEQRQRAAQARLQGIQERIAGLREGLEHASRDDALHHAANLAAESLRLHAERDEAQRRLEQHRRDLEAVRANAAAVQDQLRTAGSPDEEPVIEKLDDLRARKRRTDGERDELNARIAANRQIASSLRENEVACSEIAQNYSELEALAYTANGKLSGKDKLGFETYVQTIYFDQVLVAANARLDPMTGGRYRLIRRTRALTQRGQCGLDLDVLDNYTGKPREAASLSGGESFKASLALALGLSDVAQAHAGGIQLDTMFIDEGFGSLDQESLQLAIKTLVDVSGSGKLVGIISHVEELKASIDRKVVVERGRAGSTLRIEC